MTLAALIEMKNQLRIFSFLCFSLTLGCLGTAQKDALTQTSLGVLVGETIFVEHEPISTFRGIPYALPPVGERRWKPAEVSRERWGGRRKAKSFSPACMQPQETTDRKSLFYRFAPQMSEDCLYLNIWTSADLSQNDDSALPVMVWIHGGNLVSGSASWSIYDGAELARKGVVFVSLNYRLNVFGYFSYPELTKESPRKASGNYGVTDQVAALQWIQKNISAFGGDPDNVTIFGESAGAYSVLQLLATPLSKGLFHRAIAQSPYLKPLPALTAPRYGLPAAEESGLKFAEATGAKSLAELRALPAEGIVDELAKVDDPYAKIPNPVVDGWVFPAQLFEIFEHGLQHDVPVLIGYNSNEGYFVGASPQWKRNVPNNADGYEAIVRSRYGDLSDTYLSLYPSNDLTAGATDPYRDGFWGWAAQKVARETGQRTSKAYLYYFDQAFEWAQDRGYGAFHGIDLPYSFNNVSHNVKYSENWPDLEPTQGDLRVADMMSDYWVAFAKYGEPRVKGLPEWPAYSEEGGGYMLFHDGAADVGEDLLPGSFEFWEQIIVKRRKAGNMSWNLSNIGLMAPEMEP